MIFLSYDHLASTVYTLRQVFLARNINIGITYGKIQSVHSTFHIKLLFIFEYRLHTKLINATLHCRHREKSQRGHLFHPFLTFHISNPVFSYVYIFCRFKKKRKTTFHHFFYCSMPLIGINKTIRKTVAYIILFKNRIRDIFFTQNEKKIFFSDFAFFAYLSFSNFELLKNNILIVTLFTHQFSR